MTDETANLILEYMRHSSARSTRYGMTFVTCARRFVTSAGGLLASKSNSRA